MIFPGGGLSPGGKSWIACKPGVFLHVRVLSGLCRGLSIEGVLALHRAGDLSFFGDLAGLVEPEAFAAYLAAVRKIARRCAQNRIGGGYAKPPFGGPKAVLACLSRYTHRIAVSNSRLIRADANTVAFQRKDYRSKNGDKQKAMRLSTPEAIRRVLIHVLPPLGQCTGSTVSAKQDAPPVAEFTPLTLREPYPDCGGQMRTIEPVRRGQKPHSRAPQKGRRMMEPRQQSAIIP